MFETEDMLPRAAPKPAAPMPLGHTGEVLQPTVPEVSLLFGQQAPQIQQRQLEYQQQQPPPSQAQRPPSFDAWKKQLLPRVNFAPVLTTELGPASAPPKPPSTSVGIAASTSEYNSLPRNRAFENDVLVSTQPLTSNHNIAYNAALSAQYTREAVPSPRLPSASTTDVLTICASTQTDGENISSRRDLSVDLSSLASKQDVSEVLNLLDIMRQEQHHLRRLYETLLQQQPAPNAKAYKETAAQCEIIVATKNNATAKRITPIVHDYIVEEGEPAEPQAPQPRVLPQFNSPRATPPMAQSTGYRPNTPQGKSPVVTAVLPKANTDKSMVMNELALKYLPQRQINELMDDLRLESTPSKDAVNAGGTPLRPIDNFAPRPSDISNASYRYLKKYRLLPEEQMAYDHQMSSPQTMRRLQRTGSPSPMSPQNQQHMLDLENIRNQPKLM
ncbi:ana2 [Drosophila busckii]|uniref:Ana2 n=1 Tax=Drosophila busckii TaxID=30019 RepID=A0A0M4E7T1_DROBS|nr:uncharacterized protein LOC108595476 [Drosophila busckii]ALC40646.1 ana2 [Drosophila busckii]